MPILPLIARPQSTSALVVAFGMGTAFRGALIAGLKTDAVELVPSVPKMFEYYYPDADAVLANPNGHVIIADGRNHLELTDKHYDIIVTDPPPPIESSGASVISSREYYQAGHDHLNPGGIMMESSRTARRSTSTRRTSGRSRRPSRTSRSCSDRAATAATCWARTSRSPSPHDAIREVLGRPGVLADISSAYDSPTNTIEGWTAKIDQLTWISGAAVPAFAGDGPMVTDDRPLSEYFLLRRLAGTHSPLAVPSTLKAAADAGGRSGGRGDPAGRPAGGSCPGWGSSPGPPSSRSTSGCGAPDRHRRVGRRRLHGLLYGLDDRGRGARPEPVRPGRPDRGPAADPGRALVRGRAQPVQQPALFGPAVRAAGGAPAGDLVCRLGRDPGRPARVVDVAAADEGRRRLVERGAGPPGRGVARRAAAGAGPAPGFVLAARHGRDAGGLPGASRRWRPGCRRVARGRGGQAAGRPDDGGRPAGGASLAGHRVRRGPRARSSSPRRPP